jgi:hypothetical protein
MTLLPAVVYAKAVSGMTDHDQPHQVPVMSNHLDPQTNPGQPLIYQIRIKGQLGCEWTDWFGGLTITPQNNGETLLTGPVIDQAALYGLLKKVRNLGLPLLSVSSINPDQADPAEVQRRDASASTDYHSLFEKLEKT